MPLNQKRRVAALIVHKLKRLFPKVGMMLVYKTNWELLVSVILSAQCTDKKVNEVTQKLFRKYRTLNAYVNADKKEFECDIHATGFYRAKTKHILAAAKLIKERFDGEIPHTMQEIMTLPGVARKTANVVLGNAYGIVEGIAVDTHVRRLTRLWGLTEHIDPNKIEKDLMELLPIKEWFCFTYRVIEYGRKYCTGRTHEHAGCPIK